MSKNVGTIDRALRIVVGLCLIALALFGGHWWGWIGVVPLATAFIGFCPAYTLLGLNTCPVAQKQA
ncbi:MAG: DUF2892 domain-containing protein [Geminicoccaceae bacterium]